MSRVRLPGKREWHLVLCFRHKAGFTISLWQVGTLPCADLPPSTWRGAPGANLPIFSWWCISPLQPMVHFCKHFRGPPKRSLFLFLFLKGGLHIHKCLHKFTCSDRVGFSPMSSSLCSLQNKFTGWNEKGWLSSPWSLFLCLDRAPFQCLPWALFSLDMPLTISNLKPSHGVVKLEVNWWAPIRSVGCPLHSSLPLHWVLWSSTSFLRVRRITVAPALISIQIAEAPHHQCLWSSVKKEVIWSLSPSFPFPYIELSTSPYSSTLLLFQMIESSESLLTQVTKHDWMVRWENGGSI